jgi:hypothetical protein
LDGEQVEECLITAMEAANAVTQPELAQERLIEILTHVLISTGLGGSLE